MHFPRMSLLRPREISADCLTISIISSFLSFYVRAKQFARNLTHRSCFVSFHEGKLVHRSTIFTKNISPSTFFICTLRDISPCPCGRAVNVFIRGHARTLSHQDRYIEEEAVRLLQTSGFFFPGHKSNNTLP